MEIKILSKESERVEREWEGVKRVSFQQWAVLQQGGFMMTFLVSHQREDEVLPPGDYTLDPTSFSSKNGRLAVDRVKLKSLSRSAQPAKA